MMKANNVGFTPEQKEKLSAKFPPAAISWRVGTTTTKQDGSMSGLALAYIDARDVMNRLDEAVGAENWQDRYEVHGSKTICYLSIRIEGSDWVTKADAAGDSDVEAEKGAVSDAFKRAAVKWGIGRYLYDLESPWVALDTYTGKDGKVRAKGIRKDEYPRLHRLLGGPSKPPVETPEQAPEVAPPPKPEATPEQKLEAATKQLEVIEAESRLCESDNELRNFVIAKSKLLDRIAAYPTLEGRARDLMAVAA